MSSTPCRPRPPANRSSPYLTEFQARFSFAITAFTFIVVGTPLAIQTQRRETSFGILITFGIVLLYFVLGAVGRGLKGHAGLYPELIIWTPNFLFQAAGQPSLLPRQSEVSFQKRCVSPLAQGK